MIVSSGSSTSDVALDDRRKAMRDAIADEENADDIHLDFLDRGRVATWVRSHPSLILWGTREDRQTRERMASLR